MSGRKRWAVDEAKWIFVSIQKAAVRRAAKGRNVRFTGDCLYSAKFLVVRSLVCRLAGGPNHETQPHGNQRHGD